MLLFSIFLLVAGFSFLFTWQADQSLVKNMTFGFFQLTDDAIAQNALGKLGAWIGFVFFYKGFGIASFAFCIIFFSLGIYLLTKLQPIPIFKTLRYSFFGVIWISLILGLIFNQTYQVLGGVFGHFGIIYLQGLIGNIGTVLFLIAYILVFAVAIFNIEFYQPNMKLQSVSLFENNLAPNQSEEVPTATVGNKIYTEGGAITIADGLDLAPLNEEDFLLEERPLEDLTALENNDFPIDEDAPLAVITPEEEKPITFIFQTYRSVSTVVWTPEFVISVPQTPYEIITGQKISSSVSLLCDAPFRLRS
jgi:S-DNA-T family DNA segregation ATPase FtsK/SpoIIIE